MLIVLKQKKPIELKTVFASWIIACIVYHQVYSDAIWFSMVALSLKILLYKLPNIVGKQSSLIIQISSGENQWVFLTFEK